MSALVRLDGVHLRYDGAAGETEAVRGVTEDIGEGARIAVTGASGSGKTSLLHLIAGLEAPTSGSVTWPRWGRPRIDPTLVGLMFQSASLVPSLDVVENVALPLILHGVPEGAARERAREVLARLRLDGLRQALPEALSGGQAQRVNLARALVSGPGLLLADEPTGQLDRDTAEEVLEVVLSAVDAAGAALVISTHDESVASRFRLRWPIVDGRILSEAVAA